MELFGEADHWLPTAAPATQSPRGRRSGDAGLGGRSASDRVAG